MFYTVQELMAQIKGWEYMIAVGSLALFLGFWAALARRPVARVHREATARRATMDQPPRRLNIQTRTSERAAIAPCWQVPECPPRTRQSCPAYLLSPLPCWLAWSLVTKQRPGVCDTCPVYTLWMDRLLVKANKGGSTGAGH